MCPTINPNIIYFYAACLVFKKWILLGALQYKHRSVQKLQSHRPNNKLLLPNIQVSYVAHLSAMCKIAFTAILLSYLTCFYAPHVYFTASLPTHGCRLLWVAEEGEVHLPIVPHLCNKVRRAREVAWETSAATREQEGQTPQDQLPLQQGPTSQTSKHRSPHNRRLVKSKWGHR